MTEPPNSDPSIRWYLFIVMPILLHVPQRIGRWLWQEDDWEGITRRREFADGRQVRIFDFPTWAGRLSLHRRPRPIDRRLAGRRQIDRIVHSHWRIPWIPGGKVMPAEPDLFPGLNLSAPVANFTIIKRLRFRVARPASLARPTQGASVPPLAA